MHQIKLTLSGMINNIDDDSDLRRFTDEFFKFKNWYSEESEVAMAPDNGGATVYMCVRDAITSARMEKLGGEKFSYDFENALDYELDSYTVAFSDLVQTESDNEGTIIFSPEDGDFGEEY